MASAGADAPPAAGWERLERAARATVRSLAEWRRRAEVAEAEVARLRAELESVSAGAPSSAEGEEAGGELRRLRAENALLSSRAAEARQRIAALLSRLAVLERLG